jgi:hypothetical protein
MAKSSQSETKEREPRKEKSAVQQFSSQFSIAASNFRCPFET